MPDRSYLDGLLINAYFLLFIGQFFNSVSFLVSALPFFNRKCSAVVIITLKCFLHLFDPINH